MSESFKQDQAGDAGTLATSDGTAEGNNLATPKKDEPAYLQHLRDTGADEATIREAEDSYLRREAFTQKTQDLAEAQRAMAAQLQQAQQQVAYLQGAAGANAPAQQTPIEKLLGEIEEANPEAAPIFRELASAIQQESAAALQQQVQPLYAQQQGAQLNQALDQLFYTEVLPTFGEEVKAIWPALKQECLALTQQGVPGATPFNVLVSRHNPEAMKMFSAQAQRAETKKREAAQAAAMEGTVVHHRANPMPNAPPNKGGQVRPRLISEIANRASQVVLASRSRKAQS